MQKAVTFWDIALDKLQQVIEPRTLKTEKKLS